MNRQEEIMTEAQKESVIGKPAKKKSKLMLIVLASWHSDSELSKNASVHSDPEAQKDSDAAPKDV